VGEWIDRWLPLQDVGISTEENREYLIRRFIRPTWGDSELGSLSTEEITKWENELPARTGIGRRPARDARSLLGTILGDAAATKPPLIPYDPAIRPGNRGCCTGRRLARAPQRVWATPLQALLVAKRAALLTGRDEDFTTVVTIAYTGLRWGETIGLECEYAHPEEIHAEWQLRELRSAFHRLPPKDDSYHGRYEPGPGRPARLVIVDATVWPGTLIAMWPPAQPGATQYAPPRGRGIQAVPEDTPLPCWLPAKNGLTPHGLRHSHKTWMAEDGIPEILAEQRLRHEVPGMRGLYAHASDRMRDDLKAALQARWNDSLRERATIHPHSPVPLLDELLAPHRQTARRTTHRHGESPGTAHQHREAGEDDLPNSSQPARKPRPKITGEAIRKSI